MRLASPALIGRPLITRGDMEKIASLVYENSGIALRPELKEAMVVARLQRRLRTCGFETFADYLDHLEGDQSGGELQVLLDALTTNHTGFFREPQHFRHLGETVVPDITARGESRPILSWSAACASGEEPYSMAATLLERLPATPPDRIRILATDLASHALETARRGVYPIERVSEVPLPLLRRYFERGVDKQAGLARVKRSVRALVDFRQLNLVTVDFVGQMFDVIFCRNVMFYFDLPARQRVVTMLERHLVPGGYLFVSQTESLSEVTHGLQRRLPGVYQRGDA
jgi:chemotaxis protein methyltransferase CheR